MIKSGNNRRVENVEDVINGSKKQFPLKITNWKREPTANDLMYDFKTAQAFHSAQVSKIDAWVQMHDVKADKNAIKKGRSGVAPKVIRRLSEWRCAALTTSFLNEKKLFKVKANGPKDVRAAIQNELVLNYQFNYLINKVKFINDYVRTSQKEGTVCVRVGWDESYQTKEETIPVYVYTQATPEEALYIQDVLRQIAQEQEQTGEENSDDTEIFNSLDKITQESLKATTKYRTPVIARDTGKLQKVNKKKQVKNAPVVEIVDSRNLIIDPTCDGDIDKAKFIVYQYKTDLSTLRAAGIYKNLDLIFKEDNLDYTAEEIAAMPDEIFMDLSNKDINPNTFKFADNARKKFVAYEYWGYWDIDNTGIVQGIVATVVNNRIIRLERNPFPDGKMPFAVVPYIPVKGSVYGEPDAETVSDNQDVIKALMRSMIDIQARSANGQTAIPRGFLDPLNARKFQNGEDYEYNPIGAHPSEAIYMHTANEVSQSSLAMMQNQFAEAEAATGIKAFQNGIDGNAYGQTVAGMSQAVSALTQRESDIIFRLAKGLEMIGQKIVSMNAIWLNEEEVVEITDSDFVKINREDLSGDFRLGVDIKSNSESEGKAQQLTFMMQTLGNNLPWNITQGILTEISRLYNLDNVTTMIQQYEPQPDPIEEEKAKLEVEEQRAKVEKVRAEQRYYDARTEFILAETDKSNADTDLKSLDFVEQESGVKHERQREIVEAQAEAQNRGKLETENLKGKNSRNKAILDNASKERIAKNKPTNGNSSTSKKPRSIPNPERRATPKGLFKADGLGRYIGKDSNTVNNQV